MVMGCVGVDELNDIGCGGMVEVAAICMSIHHALVRLNEAHREKEMDKLVAQHRHHYRAR